MELTGKRIVMTGASGFIGRHVAQELLALGAEVYALVRAFSPHRTLLPIHERFHIVDGSLKDVRLCVEAAGQADGFLHFASVITIAQLSQGCQSPLCYMVQ